MEILPLKLFLAPLLVVASTLAGRRWGPHLTGVLVALPIVAGPILFISYRAHGADFAASAATSSLLGLVSLAVFAVVFARAAGRFGWLATSALNCAAVLVVDVLLSFVHATAPVALLITLLATTIATKSLPATKPDLPEVRRRPPSWDLPGRAVVTAGLVFAVTTAAGALGPKWTGLLAPFPVATSVVAAFVHAQHGSAATTRTMAGVLKGLYGFGAFCVLVAVLVRPLGGVAFLVGAVAAVAVQLARDSGHPAKLPPCSPRARCGRCPDCRRPSPPGTPPPPR
ncbi:hypothetical protein ACFFQW_31235 [Umezawaea endophytica]|uniref:Uncharacterized protein n=1 Tax=Umezawaea endophytica TaxID=1654476 RepID=A0A9X2ZXI7_9PSEU|nr:hypothetical protein [Umezawaea endophytica]MCS7475379.1 hypothetical protein [Umezawaea endophytica]